MKIKKATTNIIWRLWKPIHCLLPQNDVIEFKIHRPLLSLWWKYHYKPDPAVETSIRIREVLRKAMN